jgi:hypothetical protein
MVEPNDLLTPDDLRSWLQREILDLTKETQLRLRDAVDFVEGYASGRLSAEEATQRWQKYSDRWGESPFASIGVLGKFTDDRIIQQMDAARSQHRAR